jgi:peptidyl-prolyl cis-trans isomerase SurA
VVGELAPKLRDKIVDLKPGSASAPIKMPTGLMVLMICDRQTNKPKIPSRAQFRQRLENERLQNYARQYLMDLRRIATIDRRV